MTKDTATLTQVFRPLGHRAVILLLTLQEMLILLHYLLI